jgi:hypothetical protein
VSTEFVQGRLEQLLSDRARRGTRLDDRCAELLAQLRKRCPGAVPPPVPEPGGLSESVTVKGTELDDLLRAALAGDGSEADLVLLTDGDSELIVHPGGCRALAADGLVLVVLAVECDQTGPARVVVPIAVGTEDAVAGMVMATEAVPRGPAAVVDRWAEALVAMAWEAVLGIGAGLSRHVGADRDSLPLIPGGLVAGDGVVTVLAQARHERDRPGRR